MKHIFTKHKSKAIAVLALVAVVAIAVFYNVRATPAVITPYATDVSVSGTLETGQTLTGLYNYEAWETVGNPGFSGDVVGAYTKLKIDSNNIPYIAYSDSSKESKATVMKLNGTTWESLGSEGFSSAPIGNISFTIASVPGEGYVNVPYVAYSNSIDGKATVMRFVNNDWEVVGNPDFSTGGANEISIFVNTEGKPYVAYMQVDEQYVSTATLMELVDNNWSTVSALEALAEFITFDREGNLYAQYRDQSNGGEHVLSKFSGGVWSSVDQAGFGLNCSAPSYICYLAFDASNNPYFVDPIYGSKTTVFKLVDGFWQSVGSTYKLQGSVGIFTVDANGVPYLVGIEDLGDGLFNNKIFKLDGNSWVDAGGGVGLLKTLSLAFDSNNKSYIAFSDSGYGGKATVKRFGTTEGTSTYKWYRDGEEISGENSNTYDVKEEDLDKYISFEVTPVSALDVSGTSVKSIPVLIPGATADNVTISGDASVGATLTSSYDYSNNSASWEQVGDLSFTANGPSPDMAINSNGTPYVAYWYTNDQDETTIVVKKFNGTDWESIGTPEFLGERPVYSLAVYNNTPYILYNDDLNGDKANVIKFVGITEENQSGWESVGDPDFSDGSISPENNAFIKVDSNGNPYVAYIDGYAGDGLNEAKTTVMRFNGTDWVPVGEPGFGSSTYFSWFDLGSDNTPYVAYNDSENSEATIMKFTEGLGWTEVPTSGFSAGGNYNTYISLDSDNVPYIVSTEVISKRTYGGISVSKLVDNIFELVGLFVGVDKASVDSIALDSNNIPYLIYGDRYYDDRNLSKSNVYKFIYGSWVPVSIEKAISPRVLDLGLNNTPYILIGLNNQYVVKKLVSAVDSDSTYQWYRNGSEISGANDTTYITTPEDAGKTITFGVTPKSTELTGKEVISNEISIPAAESGNVRPKQSSGSRPVVKPTTTTPTTTTTASPSTITRTLKLGMTGEDVKALQTYLNTHGYPIATTGNGSLHNETTYFGLKTKAAVIAFQKANGLIADGVVGAKTRALMK